jgi:hypothetical protein
MVDIGTCGHGDVVFQGVAVRQAVLFMRISGVCHLKGVALVRVDVDLGQIAPLAERVRLHDEPAVCPNPLVVGDMIPSQHVRVVFEPLFVKSVDQIFVAVKPAFPREKHFESLSVSLCSGVLVAAAEDVHALLPRKVLRDAAVAVKKVVCHDDAVVAEVFVKGYIFGTCAFGACAGGRRVQVDFI